MLLLERKITEQLYDIAILGGGVAGLAAAITAGQLGLRVFVLEKAVFGGSVAVLESVSGYPGVAESDGWELTQTMVQQSGAAGCALLDSIEVIDVVQSADQTFALQCRDGNSFRSRSVIITTGGQPRLLNLKDETRFVRRGIHTCAQCAGARYKDKRVAIAGNGRWAVEAALHLLSLECAVTFISGDRKISGNAAMIAKLFDHKQFRFLPGCHIEKLLGTDSLAGIEVADLRTNDRRQLQMAAVFVYRGIVPDITIAGARQDAKGFFLVDENFMTTLPGVFATGRVVFADLPIQVLVGDGSRAALAAGAWLQATSV